MKPSILLLFSFTQILCINTVMAQKSEHTNICIQNKTNQSHYIQAVNITDHHWDGNDRPDNNFNDLTISAGETICRREEINFNSNSHFFAFLIDGNPTAMGYRATKMKDYVVGADYYDPYWGSYPNSSNPTALHGNRTIYFQAAQWWVGAPCDYENCSLFEIR